MFGVGVFFREGPEVDRNLRAVEELAGEGDHAVPPSPASMSLGGTFAGLVGGHAAIGEDEPGHALRAKVVDEVLHPGEVGAALGWDAHLPTHVNVLTVAVGSVEGRIGEDVPGARVGSRGGFTSHNYIMQKQSQPAQDGCGPALLTVHKPPHPAASKTCAPGALRGVRRACSQYI